MAIIKVLNKGGLVFSELIKADNILLDLESTEKDVLFAEMIENFVHLVSTLDRDVVLDAINEREEKQNTSIVPGIAVPHASVEGLGCPAVVTIGVSKGGVDYETQGASTPDPKSAYVHLVIMILFDTSDTNEKISVLSDCARLLQTPNFYQKCLTATSKNDIIEEIARIESLE